MRTGAGTVKLTATFNINVTVTVGTFNDTTSFAALREQAIREGATILKNKLQNVDAKIAMPPALLAYTVEDPE